MEKEKKINEILISILYFILGVILIAATNELIKTFNYILVSICAIIGVLQIINFLFNKKYKEKNYNDLLIAIIFLWVSLILYVYYGFMINVLPILFSLYLFVMSIQMISKYIELKNKKYLVLFVFSILTGLLLIFNPGSIILTYLKITGIYLIIVSIINFIDSIKLKQINNKG